MSRILAVSRRRRGGSLAPELPGKVRVGLSSELRTARLVLVADGGSLSPLSEGMGIRRATIHAMLEQLLEDEEIAREHQIRIEPYRLALRRCPGINPQLSR